MLQYIAGFLDGEGTITLTPQKGKFRYPAVSFSNNERYILEKIQNFFPDIHSIILSKKTYKDNHIPNYTLQYRYNHAISICILLLPYILHSKKKLRAQYIIDNYKKVTPRNGKYSPELLQKKLEFEENFFSLS